MHNEDASLAKARRDLAYMRVRYQGRRPAAETLLNEFDSVLDDADAEMMEIIKASEHDIALQYQGRIQQAEKREDDARNLAETMRDQVTSLRGALDEKVVLREHRARDEDQVKITIDRELGSWGWNLADLEDVAYRLRTAGATDDTKVNLSSTSITSHVPDPSVVTLSAERRLPVLSDVERAEQVDIPAWRRIWNRVWPFAAWGAGVLALGRLGEWVLL